MENIAEACEHVATGIFAHYPNAQRLPQETRHEIHGVVVEIDAENDPPFTATAPDGTEIIFHSGDYEPAEVIDQIVAFITKHRIA